MRVIHSVAGLDPVLGGPSHTVPALAGSLVRDAEVSVVLLSQKRRGTSDACYEPCAGVARHVVDVANWQLYTGLEFKKKYGEIVEECRTDLLHDHGVWHPCNHHVASMSRRFAIPLVIHPRGMLAPWAINQRAFKKRLALWLYQWRDLQTAALFFATADQEAEGIRRLGLRQPIAIIPNGVVVSPLTQGAFVGKDGEKKWRTALFLSRVHPQKGVLNLVDAWARIRPAGWRLRIAGPGHGSYAQEVLRRVHDVALASSVEYIGEMLERDKAAQYESADLFILPSFSENFGMVILEALSHGVPVITTYGTPWRELPARGCGWWVDSSVDALVETLHHATALSPDVLHAMGQKGRGYAREFDWRNIAAQTAAVYRWLLGQGPRPGCVLLD
ncbi:MAG: hypothetical protein BWK76_17360 [Desulfobulbaceae bacterium A2]|nr:MAG: hypothetical protein BWK76_17360 [Desulfobulbaceae bacterium A2]